MQLHLLLVPEWACADNSLAGVSDLIPPGETRTLWNDTLSLWIYNLERGTLSTFPRSVESLGVAQQPGNPTCIGAGLASVDRHLDTGDSRCGNGDKLGNDRLAPAPGPPGQPVPTDPHNSRPQAFHYRNGCGERNVLTAPDKTATLGAEQHLSTETHDTRRKRRSFVSNGFAGLLRVADQSGRPLCSGAKVENPTRHSDMQPLRRTSSVSWGPGVCSAMRLTPR